MKKVDVYCGVGTQEQYAKAYRLTCAKAKVIASQLTPNGEKDEHGFLVYEYRIFFEESDQCKIKRNL